MKHKNKKVVKKRKLKKKAIFFSLILIAIISLSLYYIYNIRITNIYIIDNEILSDSEIIKIAQLENYPISMQNTTQDIKKRLEKNDYINKVKVKKEGLLKEVYIYIEENKPLFYYQLVNKTVLKDGKMVDEKYNLPVVTNEISDEIFKKFIDKINDIDKNVLEHISEIKYDPNEIDQERFYLSMNDGNYVYLTLNKFSKINNYLEIVKTFNNAKGILYLDSGEYFEIKSK